MTPIERLQNAVDALDALQKKQAMHCMGACDAIGLYPGMIREYDAALNAVMDEGITIPPELLGWKNNREWPPAFVRIAKEVPPCQV